LILKSSVNVLGESNIEFAISYNQYKKEKEEDKQVIFKSGTIEIGYKPNSRINFEPNLDKEGFTVDSMGYDAIIL
jgi:hypothetical protein